MSEVPVVVVGAGPTGLTAACTLRLLGVPVVVLDQRPGPSAAPKALVVWSGAAEVLSRMGLGEQLRSSGRPLRRARYFSGDRELIDLALDQVPDTTFPAPLSVAQACVEELLRRRLIELGGQLRWGAAVDSVAQQPDGTARLGGPAGTVIAQWVIAADGVRSTLRTALGVEMAGRAVERDFLLADGTVDGPAPDDTASYHLSPDGVVVVVPLAAGGHRVFLDTAPEPTIRDAAHDPAAVISAALAAREHPCSLRDTAWSSRFRVQTRVASTFRRGNVFLAGDAAHAHSPAGGQGLNTGVQDGFDLGWRLAATLHGAAPRLLEGYEAERRPVAVAAVRQAAAQTALWTTTGRTRQAARNAALRAVGRSPRIHRRVVSGLAQLDLSLAPSPGLLGRDRAVGRRAATSARSADAVVHRLVVEGSCPTILREPPPATEVVCHPGPGPRTAPTVTWVRPDGVIGARLPVTKLAEVLELLSAPPAPGAHR